MPQVNPLIQFACFKCRKTFKRPFDSSWSNRICPTCGGIQYFMGPKFKSPSLDDKEMWKVMEVLAKTGVWMNLWGGFGKDMPFPKTVAQAKAVISMMASYHEKSAAGEKRWEHISKKQAGLAKRKVRKSKVKSRSKAGGASRQ